MMFEKRLVIERLALDGESSATATDMRKLSSGLSPPSGDVCHNVSARPVIGHAAAYAFWSRQGLDEPLLPHPRVLQQPQQRFTQEVVPRLFGTT